MTIRPKVTRPTRLESLANHRPAATFFALALVISWSLWLPLLASQSSITKLHTLPGGFGPALAALVLLRLRGTSIRAWLRHGLTWRVETRWYAIAVGLPVVLGCVMGGIFVAATGEFAAGQVARMAPLYPIMVLILSLVGGGQEEFGWRGVALPALQARFDALSASVIIGVIWAVWHLPLFVFDAPGYTNQSFVLYSVLVVGFAIVFTWLYNSTDGSILLAILLHGGINAASGLGGAFVTDPSGLEIPVLAAYAVPVWIVAGALVLHHGSDTLSAHPARSNPLPEGTETDNPDSATNVP